MINSLQTITRGGSVKESLKTQSPFSRPILIQFELRSKPSLITVICMDPQSPNKLIATKYCFLILGDDTSFFFFFSFFFFLLLLLFYFMYFFLCIYFCHENYFIFSCSGMFHVPGFIDALMAISGFILMFVILATHYNISHETKHSCDKMFGPLFKGKPVVSIRTCRTISTP